MHRWNYSTPAACVVASLTDSDAEGASYYGVFNLFFLSSQTGVLSQHIGPYQDVAWNPNANEFLLLEGPTQPVTAAIYDGKKGSKVYQYRSD